MPTKTWVVGEEVLAADFNTMVQRQVVATFPNAAGRTAAIAAPAAGMVTYLTDLQALQVYNGTAWKSVPGGVLGEFEYTVDSGGVGATPAASVMIVTANVPASGHRIRASANVLMNHTAGAGTQMHAAVYMDGAIWHQATAYSPVAGTFITLTPSRIMSPGAGSHTWQVYVWIDTGTAVIKASVTPCHLVVEDLG